MDDAIFSLLGKILAVCALFFGCIASFFAILDSHSFQQATVSLPALISWLFNVLKIIVEPFLQLVGNSVVSLVETIIQFVSGRIDVLACLLSSVVYACCPGIIVIGVIGVGASVSRN